MLAWVPACEAMPHLLGFEEFTVQLETASQLDIQRESRPSISKVSLLMKVSSCRPGRFTAPGNGGGWARRTTTSMVLVALRKVPVERMMTILFVSVVSVSVGVAEAPAGCPVSAESPIW